MATVVFQNVEHEHIRKTFLNVLNQYDSLDGYKLILKQRKVKGTTMQAQPVINLTKLFGGPDRYKIKLARYVRDSESIKVSELPEAVLKGWFAHELGHVVDYAPHSTLGMIRYGIKYLVSDRFRKMVEHRADEIAIEAGFHKEILATKRFVFDHDLIDDGYKNQMRKYYMSIEEVEMCASDKSPLQPVAHEV
ncbi:hypothetical protein SAMN05421640_0876 [Ekhidna lutea]|uniref:Uncharacterized protein n=1 Tax=Ekhidna lutea TaxID=447679 RepID=A0A239GJW8_EKHLU|nr:hypothetical protein [Ekhidna lutea]SNS69281.1 hypothetical protein SAMN05421640_0876 [Ekhidna lutea]